MTTKELNKYVKVVYQTEPIGEYKIILYLTTFDIDKYNHDIEQKEFAIEVPTCINEMRDYDFLNIIEARLNNYVKRFYEPYINEAKEYTQLLKNTYQMKLEPQIYDNVKNIVNTDKVVCNIVEGNITNCDTIYCNEIKGKVINCDKIIYKNAKGE